MRDLSTTVNGIEFENPFLLGSGPPGTNARVIAKAFRAGWGGVVAKTRLNQNEKEETETGSGPARASLPEPLLIEPPYELLPLRRLPSVPLPWLDEDEGSAK